MFYESMGLYLTLEININDRQKLKWKDPEAQTTHLRYTWLGLQTDHLYLLLNMFY